MTSNGLGIAFFAFAFISSGSFAIASSQEGLLGSWAGNCSAAPSSTNPLISFFHVPGDIGLWSLSFDTSQGGLTPILTKILPQPPESDGRISARFLHNNGSWYDVVLNFQQRHSFSAWSMSDQNGEVIIHDGRMVKTGKAAQLYRYCSQTLHE